MKKEWKKLLLCTIASIILIATVSLTSMKLSTKIYASDTVEMTQEEESKPSKTPEVEADIDRVDMSQLYWYLLGTILTAAVGITVVIHVRKHQLPENDY